MTNNTDTLAGLDTDTVEATTTATATADPAKYVKQFHAADKHDDQAVLIRGRVVNAALAASISLAELSAALVTDYGYKRGLSTGNLSQYGRAYRVVRDTDGLTISGTAGAANVGTVLSVLNRGAAGALNDWEKTVRTTATWTDESFRAAMDSLTKAGSEPIKPRAKKSPGHGAEDVTEDAAPAPVQPTEQDRLADLAVTITAVDLAELLTRIAVGRTFSEGESATLFAGMAALTDSLEHADDTVAAA